MLRLARRPKKITRRFLTVPYRRLIYRLLPSVSADVLPVDRVGPPALAALRVFLSLGNDRARMTTRTDDVRLAHHAPGVRSPTANLQVSFGNPDLDVVHVDDHVFSLRVFDDAIPGTAPQALPFGAITPTPRPSHVSHAYLARVPVSQPVARRDTSSLRM